MSELKVPPSDGVLPVELRSALEERYLAYALSTITQRALPDVRDGLKPVHRRVLWAMRELKLDPGAAFKKCARVVGDTIGKYHPHGDQSVYDALVRLAQDFAQRWPLVEGQGNFGNIDGDNAAAMRYTEARLTEVARLLLDGLDEDAVDYRATYDGTEKEPIVLPGAFPNLLANGSQGIAVGMATAIPPHNVAELVEASRALLANPDATTDDLLVHVKGPDFPTGGVIIDGPGGIAEAYRTGRGGFRTRARWHRDPPEGGKSWVVVITEIPWLVPKSRLVERIAELINDRKLPLVVDVRDESTEDVRLVLEPRVRTVDPIVMMESVFRLTELESRIPINMNVLVRGQTPMVLGLKDVLKQWLDHRREVIQRRAQHRLDAIVRRIEILEGLLIAFLNIDEVIRIVRQADDPKADLIAAFTLTDTQAEAILNMRLRSLAKLEEIEIRREHDKLTKEGDDLRALLGSEARQWKRVGKELDGLAKSFGPDTPLGKRRTTFEAPPAATAADVADAFVEREPITVVVSEKGWIRALKGHVADVSTLTFKADDALKLSFHAETTAKLLVVTSNGKAFTLDAAKLPGGRGAGEPVRLMVDIDEGSDVIDVFAARAGAKRLVATSDARGFLVSDDQLLSSTRKGRQVANLDGAARVVRFAPADGDTVAVVGQNRKLLLFPLAQVAEMARGRGVRLQRYKDGGLSDVKVFTLADGFSFVTNGGKTWSLKGEELRDWLGHRAESGRLPPRGFPASNTFA
ncbi:topoisomerase-4 subunit A [Methylopila capsulata]|uniref:DNA topoisomerase 4 subunit A n=1 Tax=Methylopila capsulata TaxID=61654 RepID=A0A9W6IT63_9HYPH|nr:DNA topoisomerase IV subunit A [Methylopila capsulata]MBM7849902.1 topoisomerase-4 subunit A [Methylopila capsulata]GLK55192.1 DNA topoisomerase 4 subunit A [Methylopila capsulata]